MNQFDLNEIKHLTSIKCVYQKGMIIYHEQDLCDRVGIINHGQIQMIHYTYQGEARVLAHLKSGDLFGDFLIHSSRPFYPGHLIAMEDTAISYIHQSTLQQLLGEQTLFRQFYLNQLSEKAMNLNLHNKVLLQSSIREKIKMWLSYQIKDEQQRVKITSKEDLANQFNVARPSLSRELSKMKQDGLIDFDRYFIYILE